MKSSLIKFPMQLHLLKENIFIILPFDFLLLCPCTTEQCMAYHWWYAYRSLRNHVLDYLCDLEGDGITNRGTPLLLVAFELSVRSSFFGVFSLSGSFWHCDLLIPATSKRLAKFRDAHREGHVIKVHVHVNRWP
jgi:hypothetical protein